METPPPPERVYTHGRVSWKPSSGFTRRTQADGQGRAAVAPIHCEGSTMFTDGVPEGATSGPGDNTLSPVPVSPTLVSSLGPGPAAGSLSPPRSLGGKQSPSHRGDRDPGRLGRALALAAPAWHRCDGISGFGADPGSAGIALGSEHLEYASVLDDASGTRLPALQPQTPWSRAHEGEGYI